MIFRRDPIREADPFYRAFRSRLDQGDGLFMVGTILQELLTGLKKPSDFEKLTLLLSSVPLVPMDRDSFIVAARISNRCRHHGIQAAAGDCLIAAACIQHGYPLLTADHHFLQIADLSPLIVLPPLGK